MQESTSRTSEIQLGIDEVTAMLEACSEALADRVRWTYSDRRGWRGVTLEQATLILHSYRSSYYKLLFALSESDDEEYSARVRKVLELPDVVLDAAQAVGDHKSWDDIPPHLRTCDCDLCLALE